VATTLTATTARAQQPKAPTAPKPAAAEPVLKPPRVLELPALALPADLEPPADGRVYAVLRVAVDGSASIESCDHGEALCALVAQAVAAARFEPGTRDGTPIPSRVGITLALAHPEALEPAKAEVGEAGPDEAQPGQPGRPPAEAEPPVDPAPDGEVFSATGRVVPPQPGMRRLELSEMRDLPGAFGDPFRAVEVLPGVVPIISGLPFVYVRGSPPSGTLYVYDDIPVPALFHLGVLASVIHPRMVGPVRLYSGVAPARYGRLTGGVVVGEGPEPPDGQVHAEAELRLLDIAGYVQSPGLGGNVTGAVRFGYPALLLSIFSPEVDLQYWDYQLRYRAPLSYHDRVEVVALGSHDALSTEQNPQEGLTLSFHRLEPRLIRKVGRTELGAALLFGWERSKLGSGFGLTATRLGPRVWSQTRFDGGHRLRLSADLVGIMGQFQTPPADPNREGPDTSFGDVPARSMWGVQAELDLRLHEDWELELGGRGDAWVQAGAAEGVLDPRGRLIWHPVEDVDLHLAGGVVHQPAVFFIPLPGIADVVAGQGLQAAIQSETGVGWDTPLGLRAEAQLFLHRYQNLVFFDTLFLQESFDMICSAVDCGDTELQDRIDGVSYGGELFLRRPPEDDLSGFVSYTLAWSRVDDVASIPYTPTWDVRHLTNLVLQWKMGAGFSAGGRIHARSGKVNGEFLLDDTLVLGREENRLPWFVRLDLQLAYAWQPSWGRMRLSLEWFNATLAREPVNTVCTGMPRTCQTIYLPAIFFPNLGLRGEI